MENIIMSNVNSDDENGYDNDLLNDDVESDGGYHDIIEVESNDENGPNDQSFTNFVSSENNTQPEHEGQANNGLTEYEKVLKQLAELYGRVKNRISQLSEQEQQQINDLLAQTSELIKNDKDNQYSQIEVAILILPAAAFGKRDTIEYLLENHHEALLGKPENLSYAIYWAARNGHDKTLELLVTKDILGKLQKQSPKILQEIEKRLNEREKSKYITPAVQKVVTEGLKNIKELKNRKTVKTALVAGGVVAGGAASVVGGTFVGALLAKKGLNLVKDTRLVTNHLLPAFNKVNDQLIKISSKLDLNKLAKAFTDPKIAALMIGMAAILGVISSIVAGVGAHKKQGGTILGR
jgi:hypothetical protein